MTSLDTYICTVVELLKIQGKTLTFVSVIDLIVAGMQQVEKIESLHGSDKSAVLLESLKSIVRLDILPESVGKEVSAIIDLNLYQPIVDTIVMASKGVYELNKEVATCCFSFVNLFRAKPAKASPK
jgi:hypothetical protein